MRPALLPGVDFLCRNIRPALLLLAILVQSNQTLCDVMFIYVNRLNTLFVTLTTHCIFQIDSIKLGVLCVNSSNTQLCEMCNVCVSVSVCVCACVSVCACLYVCVWHI